jgi:hypothetical protein
VSLGDAVRGSVVRVVQPSFADSSLKTAVFGEVSRLRETRPSGSMTRRRVRRITKRFSQIYLTKCKRERLGLQGRRSR